MRKINLVVVATVFILAGVGAWIASTPQASVAAPVGIGIEPLKLTMKAKDLPTTEYHDYTFVF